MKPGLYPAMPRDEYDAVDALNQSTIKVAYDQSLYHARAKQLEHKAPSDALIEGNALHTLILEPDLFEKRYADMPVTDKNVKHTRRTGAGATAWEEYDEKNSDKIPIKATRIAELKDVRDMVLKSPITKSLLDNATYKECSFFWEHPEFGFPCKGQLDLLTELDGWTWAIDLKSAIDASTIGFRKAVGNYGYMAQHHWYLEGLNEIAPADRRFGFVAFEKAYPHAIMMHELDPELVFEGQHRCDRISHKWNQSIKDGTYPSYPGGINVLTGSKWMMTHLAEGEEGDGNI